MIDAFRTCVLFHCITLHRTGYTDENGRYYIILQSHTCTTFFSRFRVFDSQLFFVFDSPMIVVFVYVTRCGAPKFIIAFLIEQQFDASICAQPDGDVGLARCQAIKCDRLSSRSRQVAISEPGITMTPINSSKCLILGKKKPDIKHVTRAAATNRERTHDSRRRLSKPIFEPSQECNAHVRRRSVSRLVPQPRHQPALHLTRVLHVARDDEPTQHVRMHPQEHV